MTGSSQVHGFHDIQEVANTIYGGILDSLLRWQFVFAYRGTTDTLVVTLRSPGVWSYGIITPGWTGVIPRALSLEPLISLMVDRKYPKEVVADLKTLTNNE